LLHAYDISVATGGNIGIGMFELLNNSEAQLAVLELSSFQLELCKQFSPTLGIWTNFFPNHLDRHGTQNDYFLAKYQLLARQKTTDHAILPTSLIPWFNRFGWPASQITLIDDDNYIVSKKSTIPSNIALTIPIFTLQNNSIIRFLHQNNQKIISLDQLSIPTFLPNILILVATLYVLGLDCTILSDKSLGSVGLNHRLEYCGTVNGIIFYNDSKSTTPISTMTAVKVLHNKNIRLILGGLSKGVDRTIFIQEVATLCKEIIFFGAEADTLANALSHTHYNYSVHKNLDSAFLYTIGQSTKDDCILFSPSGSSYDLYKDYQERGIHFKQLIENLKNGVCKKGI
jgi:UDP-N-acetylmuramoylalanine--D-glutamate ligase